MTNTVDNFQHALADFKMTMPPTGDLVCRMSKATLDKLKSELVDYDVVIGANAGAFAILDGYEGIFCGALLKIDNSQADGEFAFSVRIKGSKSGHEFAGWEPVDCSDPADKGA